MATVSFISPKVMFNKLADVLYNTPEKPQKRAALDNRAVNNRAASKTPASGKNNKLSVSKDDVKIISAALIHYKKFLARKKQLDKAEEVGDVDKKFMAFIQALEGTTTQTTKTVAPLVDNTAQKTLKRTVTTQDIDLNKEYKTPKLPQETLQTEWVVKKPKIKKRSAS
ncbi:hypothetical protein [Microscilla marina]|uniref:Uncharacterized protein n=1 Tax=Microscilla marina ATCC 23134 TaxID=313606 RepID=A1ZP13_MICM2|nr:hypothetical protein [Microscilla marina]EAY27805.1 hypothetical protein M23134_00246 [Microscilla marina ATCC 23134]